MFDLLARNGRDLRTGPYSRRRRALEKLLARHLPDRLTLMPMTTDLAAAQLWMVDRCAAGIEGVVAKRLDQAYRSGGRRKVAHQNDSGGRRGRRGPGGDLVSR